MGAEEKHGAELLFEKRIRAIGAVLWGSVYGSWILIVPIEDVGVCLCSQNLKSQVLNYYNCITAIYTLTIFNFSDNL